MNDILSLRGLLQNHWLYCTWETSFPQWYWLTCQGIWIWTLPAGGCRQTWHKTYYLLEGNQRVHIHIDLWDFGSAVLKELRGSSAQLWVQADDPVLLKAGTFFVWTLLCFATWFEIWLKALGNHGIAALFEHMSTAYSCRVWGGHSFHILDHRKSLLRGRLVPRPSIAISLVSNQFSVNPVQYTARCPWYSMRLTDFLNHSICPWAEQIVTMRHDFHQATLADSSLCWIHGLDSTRSTGVYYEVLSMASTTFHWTCLALLLKRWRIRRHASCCVQSSLVATLGYMYRMVSDDHRLSQSP